MEKEGSPSLYGTKISMSIHELHMNEDLVNEQSLFLAHFLHCELLTVFKFSVGTETTSTFQRVFRKQVENQIHC